MGMRRMGRKDFAQLPESTPRDCLCHIDLRCPFSADNSQPHLFRRELDYIEPKVLAPSPDFLNESAQGNRSIGIDDVGPLDCYDLR
jgi:hypothetical protein